MLGTIRHRGPDQFGIYLDDHVGLGNARLSIIDLSTGQQPIANEDESLWIVFNGEVFNHPELRLELEARGTGSRTTCDTEVVLHAYEEYGAGLPVPLQRPVRDRHLGQRGTAACSWPATGSASARSSTPRPDGALVFGSEIKAILAAPGVTAAPDPLALDQIFTFWSTLSPRTFFRGITELPPGHFMRVKDGRDHAGALLGDGLPRGRRGAAAAHAGVRGGAARPAHRRRAHPAARRRPRRRLPERRARLLDHHGHRPQPDDEPAGDVLHRLHRRATTTRAASSSRWPRPWAPSTTWCTPPTPTSARCSRRWSGTPRPR